MEEDGEDEADDEDVDGDADEDVGAADGFLGLFRRFQFAQYGVEHGFEVAVCAG